jgi:hypothetical protein
VPRLPFSSEVLLQMNTDNTDQNTFLIRVYPRSSVAQQMS